MAGAIKRTKATNQMMWKKAGTLKKKLKYSDLTEYQMVLKGYYLRYILLDKTFFHNYLLPPPPKGDMNPLAMAPMCRNLLIF